MSRFLLLSVLAASLLMPSLAARETNPARGLKKLKAGLFGFSLFYWLAVMLATPQP